MPYYLSLDESEYLKWPEVARAVEGLEEQARFETFEELESVLAGWEGVTLNAPRDELSEGSNFELHFAHPDGGYAELPCIALWDAPEGE